MTSSEGGASLDPFLFVLDGDSEALLQQGELADEVSDGVGEGFLSTAQHDVTSCPLVRRVCATCSQACVLRVTCGL